MNHDIHSVIALLQRLFAALTLFRTKTARLLLHLGDRLVVLERTMVESRKDRQRLHADDTRETELRKQADEQLRREVAQLRIWFFFLLAAVGSLVFVFVLAIVFGGR